MRAVIMTGYGGIDKLELAEVPDPVPAEGEMLVRIRASGVNPADGKWRAGMFASFVPLQFPHILGYDVAGTVADGHGGERRVAAMLDPFIKGGYAEYAAVPADRLATIPESLSFETAAAVPTAGLTGVQLVECAVEAGAGQCILITGAIGAVGRFAVHAAKRRGAHVVAAVRDAQRAEALALGADETTVLGDDPWSGARFDHVIDTVGGPAVAALCGHLRPGGRIATVATTPIDPEGLPAVPEFYAVRPDAAGLARLLAAVAGEEVAVPIARTLPLAEAAEAQRLTDAGGLGGKVILKP